MRSKKVKEAVIDKFFSDISKFNNKKDVADYFSLILTERELNDVARRHKTVELLGQGKTYKEIQEELEMSAATICRLSGKIGYGVLENNRSSVKKVKPKNKKRIIRYKGAPTIRELMDL